MVINASPVKNPKGVGWNIHDIEDLHRIANESKICPYYLQKQRVMEADIIFMPYNYILDPKIRGNFNLDFENSVIIFDEAHNIEKVCEDISSFELNISQLDEVLLELNLLQKRITHSDKDKEFSCNLDQVQKLKDLTENFKTNLKGMSPKKIKGMRKLIPNNLNL